MKLSIFDLTVQKAFKTTCQHMKITRGLKKDTSNIDVNIYYHAIESLHHICNIFVYGVTNYVV